MTSRHIKNGDVTLHPAMEAATDGDDAGAQWDVPGVVPGLQPPLPILVYSE